MDRHHRAFRPQLELGRGHEVRHAGHLLRTTSSLSFSTRSSFCDCLVFCACIRFYPFAVFSISLYAGSLIFTFLLLLNWRMPGRGCGKAFPGRTFRCTAVAVVALASSAHRFFFVWCRDRRRHLGKGSEESVGGGYPTDMGFIAFLKGKWRNVFQMAYAIIWSCIGTVGGLDSCFAQLLGGACC